MFIKRKFRVVVVVTLLLVNFYFFQWWENSGRETASIAMEGNVADAPKAEEQPVVAEQSKQEPSTPAAPPEQVMTSPESNVATASPSSIETNATLSINATSTNSTSNTTFRPIDLPLEAVGDIHYVPPAKEHPIIMVECPEEDRLVSAVIKARTYGLTNQLISFAGLFAFAVRCNRTVYLGKTRVPLTQLVNLTTSYFPKGLRICTKMNKRHKVVSDLKDILKKAHCGGLRCFKHVDRIAVNREPIKVMRALDNVINGSTTLAHVQLWDMFLRYPYPGEVNAAALPTSFLCGLGFPNTAVVPFKTAMAGLQAKCSKGDYIGAHMRLELDAVSVLSNRKLPTTEDVYDFFTGPLAAFAREHEVSCVLICVGDITPEFEDVIDKASNDTGILFSRKTTFLREGAIAKDPGKVGGGVYYGKWVPVTSFVGATVDLMLMEHAKATVIGTFSSFGMGVYSRRCGGLGCSNNSNVFVYDMYLDGTFTDIRPYPCNHSMGTVLTGPPHLIKPPTPDIAFFFEKFDFNPASPLFTNTSRNENKAERVTVDEPHWVSWGRKKEALATTTGVNGTGTVDERRG